MILLTKSQAKQMTFGCTTAKIIFGCYVTSPIYRTCSLNSRKCSVLCRCLSWQMPNLVFRVLSIPYTLALKAASIAVVLTHHAHPMGTTTTRCLPGVWYGEDIVWLIGLSLFVPLPSKWQATNSSHLSYPPCYPHTHPHSSTYTTQNPSNQCVRSWIQSSLPLNRCHHHQVLHPYSPLYHQHLPL